MLPWEALFAAPHTPRPRYGVPRRACPSVGWLPIGKFSTQGGAAAQPRAARRASVQSAPSNTRLKLAATSRIRRASVLGSD